MKILKNLLIALAVIIVVGGVVLYFLPNHYTVSNSIEIDKPANAVYAQIYDFNKWGSWDPWMEMDPAAKVTVEGTPGTPGHKMSWDGQKSGMGSMTIISSGPNQFVYSDLEFLKPFKASARDKISLEADGDKTKVTWTNTGGSPFPMGRFMGLFMDKMLGPDQRKGLDKLKKSTEAMPAPMPEVASADTATTKSM